MNLSSEKENKVKISIFWLRGRLRLKGPFSSLRKILIHYIGEPTRVKPEEELKSHLSSHMLISKVSITTLHKKREWIWVLLLQSPSSARNK
jgi:hypothetical protein